MDTTTIIMNRILEVGEEEEEKEKEEVKKQIKDYKKYWNLIHNGMYYRLTDPINNQEIAAWEFVSENRKETLINIVSLTTHANAPVNYVRCKGLNPEKNYCCAEQKTVYSGSALMSVGIPVKIIPGEYHAWQMHLTESV